MAAQHSLAEMEALLGVDSLAFISIDGLYRAVGEAQRGTETERTYCDACFTGDYFLPLTDRNDSETTLPTELSRLRGA